MGFLKNPGGGKNKTSVFDALKVLPTCISSAKCAKWRQITAEPISSSLRDRNVKAPSSTYNIQKISKRIPSEKSGERVGTHTFRGGRP